MGWIWLGLAALVTLSNSRSSVEQLIHAQFRRASRRLRIAVPPPLVESSSVANAASDGRSIIYNQEWIESLLRRHCNASGCIAAVLLWIMSHELAHHLLGHATNPTVGFHERELIADEVAARVMAREGVPPVHVATVLLEFGLSASTTHPGARARHSTIFSAYEDELFQMTIERAA